MVALTDEARSTIEQYLDSHAGKPPESLPRVERIRPWGEPELIRKTFRFR